MIERKTISDVQLKSEMFSEFEKGNTGKVDVLGLLRTRFKLGRSRFFEQFDINHSEWATIKDKATSDTVQANTKEGLKSGLKSKIEHQLEIQSEIKELQELLKKGFVMKRIKISEDESLEKKEIFGSYEIAQISGVIDRKRKELFLLDGMYSPAKIAQTDTDGNNFQAVTKIEIVKSIENDED